MNESRDYIVFQPVLNDFLFVPSQSTNSSPMRKELDGETEETLQRWLTSEDVKDNILQPSIEASEDPVRMKFVSIHLLLIHDFSLSLTRVKILFFIRFSLRKSREGKEENLKTQLFLNNAMKLL